MNRDGKSIAMLLVAILVGVCTGMPEAYAETIYAKSPSYSDVSAAISSASDGDTVVVPAGSANWNSKLIISKAITLQGAGRDQTIIKNTFVGPYDGGSTLISISLQPDTPLTRLTGFTFDAGQNGHIINISRGTSPVGPGWVRIDNNRLRNVRAKDGNTYRAIQVRGAVYGVIDNNIIIDVTKGIDVYAYHTHSWQNFPAKESLGSEYTLYIEDNHYLRSGDLGYGVSNLASHGHGGRSVWRYNTIDYTKLSDSYNQMFDAHGNQQPAPDGEGVHRGTVILEIYRNDIIDNRGQQFVDPRGGTLMIWENTSTGGSTGMSMAAREEDGPERFNRLSTWPGEDPVRDVYAWGNTRGGYIKNFGTRGEKDGVNWKFIQPDRDYWNQNDNFDGTKGIGVGSLANRPNRCTPARKPSDPDARDNMNFTYRGTGPGYWATDQGNWNKSGKDGQGVLYRCVDTNTWELYYTPYEYPHPLRAGDFEHKRETPSAGALSSPKGLTIFQAN